MAHNIRRALLVIATTMAVGSPAASSFAAGTEDAVGRLRALTAGVTNAQFDAALAGAAQRRGVSVKTFAATALKEISAKPATKNTGKATAPDALVAPLGSGGGTVALGIGRNDGDVFYAPSGSSGFVYGHSGIYWGRYYIIEAPGIGQGVRRVYAPSAQTARGTWKQYVLTSQTVRGQASDFAATKLGVGYNLYFWDNKYTSGLMNCSQLVWASYVTRGINLDYNGGSSVMPIDIYYSNHTVNYEYRG